MFVDAVTSIHPFVFMDLAEVFANQPCVTEQSGLLTKTGRHEFYRRSLSPTGQRQGPGLCGGGRVCSFVCNVWIPQAHQYQAMDADRFELSFGEKLLLEA